MSSRYLFLSFFLTIVMPVGQAAAQNSRNTSDMPARSPYVFNRAPLAPNPYATLPIGAVAPQGWLREQLVRMANGMAGHLDELYPLVGKDNGWVGGPGDSWERGPYWLDGLVPLAYILKDERLIAKAKPYIEWTLASQQPSGFFGPRPEDEPAASDHAVQRANKADWWPRMVALKYLQSYYEATGDARVPRFMTNYFRYQHERLPSQPLDTWTQWAKSRGGENQASVYWLYNRTGDAFLLDLAKTLFDQTRDWTGDFRSFKQDLSYAATHGVNVAMAVKQPAMGFVQTGDTTYLNAIERGLWYLTREHGQVQGLFSGDENLHGTDPTQGTELCTIVELMYSLETVGQITGDVRYLDHLERVAYNALPAHITPEYSARQYFQQPNQVQVTVADRNFITRHDATDLNFGVLTGYPCCTTNMHQGWPKFVQHLWLASRDGGLAALVYGPGQVEARVAGDVIVRVIEETGYPFDETIRFRVEPERSTTFPLHLRIPQWAEGATIRVNGQEAASPKAGTIARLERTWKAGDVVELTLPMTVRISRWHENSAGVERGPLVFALQIDEKWERVKLPNPSMRGEEGWNVLPGSPWNYGLMLDEKNPAASFDVVRTGAGSPYPWTTKDVPIRLRARGKRLPQWQLYGNSAGPLPFSPVRSDEPIQELTLIPYGAARLRISEFPVVQP